MICNALPFVLRVDPSRGAVPEGCLGTVVHDHFAPYFSRLGKVARHAMCNVHHKREAKAAFEQDGHPWAGEMIRLFDRAKRATDIARRLDREALPPSLLAKFDRWFDRIIANGEEFHDGLEPFEPARAGKRGRKKRRIAENFLRRLKDRKKETLLFLHDLSVPFSNNEAERNIRMITVKENISGCFRTTLEGAEDHVTPVRWR